MIEKLTTLKAFAAPLPRDNVDTDVIYPAKYLTTVRRTGLGDMAFEGLRFRPDGSRDPDSVFNQSPFDKAKILVAGHNFGCGSSREHAVWALHGMGFRCVIARSFGDIFFSNCFRNGVLAIELPDEQVDHLIEASGDGEITIDLDKQTISLPGGEALPFDIDAFQKNCLMEGQDAIALTLLEEDEITAFEARQRTELPWLYAMETTERGTGS